MAKAPLPFAGGFYQSDYAKMATQECVNFYPVTEDGPAIQQETLRCTPGLTLAAELDDPLLTNRGGHKLNSSPYFVNGTGLYRLESGETLTYIGPISGTERVIMADNGTQMMILVPGGNGYIFTESPDTLTSISDLDFTANGNPLSVVFIDSYFCCTTDAKKFIISAENDGLSWNALDFGSAESSPDGTVTPVVFKNQLFIGGERTTEAFSNTGNVDFPFQRTGLFLTEGFSSLYSVVNAPDTFVFVGAGEDELPAVWMFEGNSTKRISHRGIEKILRGVPVASLSDIFALSYFQDGNYFISFNLPTTTIVYDLIAQKWHERRSFYDGSAATGDPWRVASIVEAYGKIYVGDQYTDRISVLDPDAADEAGNNVERWFATMPFQNNMQNLFVPSIELTIDARSTCIPAYITTQPTDAPDPYPATEATFTVVAGGSAPLAYQWYADDVLMVGETSATLTVTAPDSGEFYHVVVTNACGNAKSVDVQIESGPL